jgi:hypothetical protein
MDIYGGPGPVQAILIPRPGGDESCPLKERGKVGSMVYGLRCPPGCRVCVDFAEEMHHRGTENTEHGTAE